MTDTEAGEGDEIAAEPLLPDGDYDAFVVDATEVLVDDAPATDRVMHLELTITSGEHKGRVLGIAARGLAGEEYELLGLPATLTITAGIPAVRIDT
jgi:hypothetical protein